MSQGLALLQHCNNYLRSMTTAVGRPATSISTGETLVKLEKRVLIVEFRDEVFADLKSVFEDQGCKVARAISGAAVGEQAMRFAPDLLLLNENMPDQSGRLIACKLRLAKHGRPVWLYAVQEPRFHSDWKELCGVDEVFEYGGVLSRLSSQIRKRLKRWLASSESGVEREQTVRTFINPPVHERRSHDASVVQQ